MDQEDEREEQVEEVEHICDHEDEQHWALSWHPAIWDLPASWGIELGGRGVDITYCPFCGVKLEEVKE